VFLDRTLTSLVQGETLELPVRFAWQTEDGTRIDLASLAVRRHDVLLFDAPLAGTIEVALTPSDAPYAFAIRKQLQEDVVLAVETVSAADPPPVLESARLGIRLVPMRAAPPDAAPRTKVRDLLPQGTLPPAEVATLK